MTVGDSSYLDAGIRKLADAIVCQAIADYVNAVVFENRHNHEKPISAAALRRKRDKERCERFFVCGSYSMMSDRDGRATLEFLKKYAANKKAYLVGWNMVRKEGAGWK